MSAEAVAGLLCSLCLYGALPLDLDQRGLDVAVRSTRRRSPHPHDLQSARTTSASTGRPLLITILPSSAWLHGYEGGAGRIHTRCDRRLRPRDRASSHSAALSALLPYIVASQTIPILAVAPMVVVWLKSGWQSVAVIAAYLTFFPVTINTLRGLQSVEPRGTRASPVVRRQR